MASALRTAKNAIITKMRTGIPALQAIVAQKIFTHVPENTLKPYVLVQFAANDWSDKIQTGYELFFECTYASKEPTDDQVAAIHEAIRDAFHMQSVPFPLSASGKILSVFHQSVAFTTDADGSTHLGTDRYRVLVNDQN